MSENQYKIENKEKTNGAYSRAVSLFVLLHYSGTLSTSISDVCRGDFHCSCRDPSLCSLTKKSVKRYSSGPRECKCISTRHHKGILGIRKGVIRMERKTREKTRHFPIVLKVARRHTWKDEPPSLDPEFPPSADVNSDHWICTCCSCKLHILHFVLIVFSFFGLCRKLFA